MNLRDSAMLALAFASLLFQPMTEVSAEKLDDTYKIALASPNMSLFTVDSTAKTGAEGTKDFKQSLPLPQQDQGSEYQDLIKATVASKVFARGSICDGSDIYSKRGINRLNLEDGNYLVSSKKESFVKFREGILSIAANSMVFVMSTRDCTAIYDLHDSKSNAVFVSVGQHRIRLLPGQQLVVSKTTADFDEINPLAKLGYRKRSTVQAADLYLHFADFSIPSAFRYIEPLIELSHSQNKQHMKSMEQLLKTAAIVTQITMKKGAYSSSIDLKAQGYTPRNTLAKYLADEPAKAASKARSSNISLINH
ncbi:MAG: hypothetical protein K2X81_26300 [Candidatus Obscuribacterales bacterium]|nr:hypothetical protein [Candidatus Obscuribacterales bacterium]